MNLISGGTSRAGTASTTLHPTTITTRTAAWSRIIAAAIIATAADTTVTADATANAVATSVAIRINPFHPPVSLSIALS